MTEPWGRFHDLTTEEARELNQDSSESSDLPKARPLIGGYLEMLLVRLIIKGRYFEEKEK